MLRSLFVPASVFLFGLSSSVFASSAPAPECYPLVHGENGQGSTNSLYLPHLVTLGHWHAYISVTNTGIKPVNVKLTFKSPDARDYTPYHAIYIGQFNSGNSPLNLKAGGAILKPNETARVGILDESYGESLFGIISWQADSCLDSALLVSVRSIYNSGSFPTSLMLLNNGQPF